MRVPPWLWIVAAAMALGGCRLPSSLVEVAVEPVAVVLAPGGSQAFTATVTGTPDATVDWTASCGDLEGSGLVVQYTAPAAAGSCTVTVTSVADPTAAAMASVTVEAAPPGEVVWLRRIVAGEGLYADAAAVALDAAGHALVAGTTNGDLGGPNAGRADAFVAKYDALGGQMWLRQFGTAVTDWASAVAVGPDGRVLVTGYTAGDLDGSDAGRVYLIAFGAAGDELWRRQFGATPDDYGLGVAVDAHGNAFVVWYASGFLGDGVPRSYISKFDDLGDELWRRSFWDGFPHAALAVDPQGGVLVTGASGTDVLVVTFDADGEESGRRTVAAPDFTASVTLWPDGRMWVVGGTTEDPDGGPPLDVFELAVSAFGPDGELAWRRQVRGGGRGVHGRRAAVDAQGRVLVVGAMEWPDAIDGEWTDALLVQLDADGRESWRRLFRAGGGGPAWSTDAAFADGGDLVVVGGTFGPLVATTEAPPAPLGEFFDTEVFVMRLRP